MIHDSEHQDHLQIEQAANGLISGYLGEWPHLKAALRRRGIQALDFTPCKPYVQDVCKELLAKEKP